jgi:DNA-binding NarL/FixJ family response regulator
MGVALQLFSTMGAGSIAGSGVVDPTPLERARSLGLSGREVEIAVMIGRGLTNKEIAAELHISTGTVRTHVYNLYRKAGAGNRVELVNLIRD